MGVKKVIVLVLGLIFINVTIAQHQIQRIEPPNWWVGMESPNLQLLVYGDNIQNLEPSIEQSGIKIYKVTKVSSPNYLFIDLILEKTVKPGLVNIEFKKDGQLVETHAYELKKRQPGAKAVQGFDNSDVLYLITPDRFANGDVGNDELAEMAEKRDRSFKGGRHGGDIQGIRDHLDYISGLGFTAIWVNPVLENNMQEYSYHGYSTTDFYKVDPRFGTNEEYLRLAEEARSKGIKLIMDMIVNHCGSEHWWMNDLPMEDWINQWDNYTQTNHKKTVLQDPHVADIDKKTFTDGWFVPTMPDLNQRNEFMGIYLIQNSIWWIEFLGLAGIRMDTYPYPDMDYMTLWTARIMEEYPNFNVVGEEWFGDPSIVAYWQAGKDNPNGYTSSLKSLMDFPIQEALVESLNPKNERNGNSWMKLYEMLAQDFVYAAPNDLVVFPDNHDMSRIFTQLGEDFGLFKLALTYILTTRGIPQIYYGTEILMTNRGTTDHGIIRSDFPGGWDGDAVNAFTGNGLRADQKEAMAFLKNLLQWRKNEPVIHYGKLKHFIPEAGVYVYFRYLNDKKIMVALNKNENAVELELDRFAEMLGGVVSGKNILTQKDVELGEQLTLPAKGPLVLSLNK